MDLSKIPGCSEEIYLRDLSERIKTAEGDVRAGEQLVVTINFANEGDRIEHDNVGSKHETRITLDEVVEVETRNERLQMETDVYLVLNSVRGLKSDGAEVFRTIPIRRMGFENFQKAWRDLPPMITDAIYSAVLLHNPEWNWEG